MKKYFESEKLLRYAIRICNEKWGTPVKKLKVTLP